MWSSWRNPFNRENDWIRRGRGTRMQGGGVMLIRRSGTGSFRYASLRSGAERAASGASKRSVGNT